MYQSYFRAELDSSAEQRSCSRSCTSRSAPSDGANEEAPLEAGHRHWYASGDPHGQDALNAADFHGVDIHRYLILS